MRAQNYILLLGLVLLACHDAPRKNPFDTALTPAVELQVALDVASGTAALSWTPYAGRQPFAEYWVLRKVQGREAVDTLTVLSMPTQTTFIDTALMPDTAYDYRVSVVNTGGFEVPSQQQSIPGYEILPVQLLAATSDAQTGTVALRWTRFTGARFQTYEIRRRLTEALAEETLSVVTSVEDTTFAEDTARAYIGYFYRIVVRAAGEELTSNSLERRLELPPVAIQSLEFNSLSASANIEWTRYTGPRFQAYQVWRRQTGLEPTLIAEIADATGTSTVDTGLLGNTEYAYQIAVLTTVDEIVASEERSEQFHALVDSWSLPIEEGESVRLYSEREGEITALVAGLHQIKLLVFDLAGALLSEQVLLDIPLREIEPRSVTTAINAQGHRFISVGVKEMFVEKSSSSAGGDFGRRISPAVLVLEFDPSGAPVQHRRSLFADAVPNPLAGEYSTIKGEILVSGVNFRLNNLAVSTNEDILFADDFADEDYSNWDVISFRTDEDGMESISSAIKRDSTWTNFRLEVNAIFKPLNNSSLRLSIGSQLREDTSFFTLIFNAVESQSTLFWTFNATDSALESQLVIQEGVLVAVQDWPQPYRLSLGVIDRQFNASIAGPLFQSPWDETSWTSLTSLGDLIGFSIGDTPYTAQQDGEIRQGLGLPTQASESRIFELPEESGQWIGICLPQMNRVLIARSFANLTGNIWPEFEDLGPGAPLGTDKGVLNVPLSFDVAPDGRFFVLDAGTAEIKVFDAAGNYITQWGRRGQAPSAFDFGTGRTPTDLAGSIAVDAEGFIYVADTFNQRIQKFAP